MAATSRTLKITSSTTQHVTNLNVYGGSGHAMSVQSTTAGTAYNLTKDGGGVFSGVDYLNVKDTNVTNTTWYIGHNSTSVSGNTNVVVAIYLSAVLSDVINLTETLRKALTKTAFSTSITLTETIKKSVQRSISSSISLSEAFAKGINKISVDIISFFEFMLRNLTHSISSTVSLSETLIKTRMFSFLDHILRQYLETEDGIILSTEAGELIILEYAYVENTVKTVGKNSLDLATIVEKIKRFGRKNRLFRYVSELFVTKK